jgi:hypothetical protein
MNSTVSGNVANHAESVFCSGFGGGIHNGGMQNHGGTVTITNSIVSNNSTGLPSGPPFPCGYGGGILNQGAMTITNSTISGNTAGLHGGGICHFNGTLTISNSTVSENGATGIHNGDAQGVGGGIESEYTLTITNSTISGNYATHSGGGIAHGIFTRITNSTISGNTANQGGGIASSAAEACSPCQLEIANTILKGGAAGTNIFMFNNTGTATSLGYNLSSDDGGGVLTATGDQINTDPMLGPLQNNGGPTFTHDLLTGSPGIDAGDPNFTPPPLYDQRGPGYGRVVNGRIDVGSLEVQAVPATPTPTATATPTTTATATPTPTTPPPATPTPTPSPTTTPSPNAAQALNISTRLRVETGNNVLIAGFIVTGNAPKNVAVRGIGPSLAAFGISDALADPTLELRSANGALIAGNDNWQDDRTQASQLSALGLALQNPSESGLVATLKPGASYTAILAGKNGGTGVGLVEVYDTNPGAGSQLANISTRGFVQTGNNVMIGGFILGGGNSTQVAVRGIGPSLAQFGLNPVLSDPTLELRDNNGALLISNDDWQDNPLQAAQLSAHGLALPNAKDPGIFASLPPGAFTAILAGKNGGTGIGLVEIYNVH